VLDLIWKEGKRKKLNDSRIGIICPLLKKGDPMQCANYRGITLLNTTYKVFSKIVYARLLHYAQNMIGNYQSGLSIGKSTTNSNPREDW
jgi:sorting nexin-29